MLLKLLLSYGFFFHLLYTFNLFQPAAISKTAGVTQSLTPAQLQLLQQAAAAQAAHVKAQAEAQASKAQAQALAKGQTKSQGKNNTHLIFICILYSFYKPFCCVKEAILK